MPAVCLWEPSLGRAAVPGPRCLQNANEAAGSLHCSSFCYVRGRVPRGAAHTAHLTDTGSHIRPCLHREAQACTSAHPCTPAVHSPLHALTHTPGPVHTHGHTHSCATRCLPCPCAQADMCSHPSGSVTRPNTHANVGMLGHTVWACVSLHMLTNLRVTCTHTLMGTLTRWVQAGGESQPSNSSAAGARPELCSEMPLLLHKPHHAPAPSATGQGWVVCGQQLSHVLHVGWGGSGVRQTR